MNVKEAVSLAKTHVATLFDEEGVQNVGLEEVEFDQQAGEWMVTVGFSRPWDRPQNSIAVLTSPNYVRRTYKIVRVDEKAGEVVSVKNRDAAT